MARNFERTFQVGQRALELMKTYGSSANPRSYELWYTYVTGQKPVINCSDQEDRRRSRAPVRDDVVEALHAEHLSPQKFAQEAEKTGGHGDLRDRRGHGDAGDGARLDRQVRRIARWRSPTISRSRSTSAAFASSSPLSFTATKDVGLQTTRRWRRACARPRGEIEVLRETLEAVRIESLTDPADRHRPTASISRRCWSRPSTRRSSSAAPLALIVIDIDHFKRFNDTYGHLTGDQVLRLVGMTMREQVKTKATLARFGGEEFGIILPDTTLDTARHHRRSGSARTS